MLKSALASKKIKPLKVIWKYQNKILTFNSVLTAIWTWRTANIFYKADLQREKLIIIMTVLQYAWYSSDIGLQSFLIQKIYLSFWSVLLYFCLVFIFGLNNCFYVLQVYFKSYLSLSLSDRLICFKTSI